MAGTAADGHDYISSAVDRGASAIICEKVPDSLKPGVIYLQMTDLRQSVGHIAAAFYGHPARQLKVVGVTGTNGKSSIVTILQQLFRHLGYQTGLLSTIENQIGDNRIASTLTTPDAVDLQQLLRMMVDHNVTHCFMEVSSHALDQGRVQGVSYDVAVFTNMSHDHLNYHGTFDNYIAAKKKLFDGLSAEATAVVNIDDRRGYIMVQNSEASLQTCAIKTLADHTAKIIELSPGGLQLQINGSELHSPLLGVFNAYNLLLAYGTAIALGEDRDEVLRLLSVVNAPSGRFEAIMDEKSKTTYIVDYAHTPDALENVLTTMEAIKSAKGKLIAVVGCGGERDRSKRPIMARLAAAYCDRAIFTSDNPRREDPELILDDMMAGLDDQSRRRVLRITSRREAIRTAAALASAGDMILIAGKGHEGYQSIGGENIEFQDQDVVREIINQR